VEVEKGEFVFLVGTSGSGKSTALRLVLRELRPTGGRVYVAGKEIKDLVPETLELVGLSGKGDRMPDELSGGEQQRVAIARAFANKPMILIADEPTGNLDPNTSVGIMKLLDRINRTGTTVVMATHDSSVVDQMRKRVIELSGGRVMRDQARGVYGYQH
jgi:cell division transport system ATP-binding protein